MTGDRATPLTGGVALLERAISYTLGVLCQINPGDLARPTPCRDWDLAALLAHMNDSVMALFEAVDVGRVALDIPDGRPAAAPGDLVGLLRDSACRLLGAWTNSDGEVVSIGDTPLTTGIVTSAGALELAVHGWDAARARGAARPIPAPLAAELLPLARLLVTDDDRPVRFAPQIPVPPAAPPGDRLLGHLGRDPR